MPGRLYWKLSKRAYRQEEVAFDPITPRGFTTMRDRKGRIPLSPLVRHTKQRHIKLGT